MRIVDLLPAAPVADPAHASTLLELAYLMAAADGRVTDEERRAFGELAERLGGGSVDELLDRFSKNVARSSVTERVRAIAPGLPPELGEASFKIAIRLALADADAAREEDRLVQVLYEALGLDEARADALAAEARGSSA